MKPDAPLYEQESERRGLIVLNNDTLVCEGCYELNAPSETTPDVDYGLWPMGRVTEGQCSNCGDTLPASVHREEGKG